MGDGGFLGKLFEIFFYVYRICWLGRYRKDYMFFFEGSNLWEYELFFFFVDF